MFNSDKAAGLKAKFAEQLKTNAVSGELAENLLDLIAELSAEIDILKLRVEEANEKADSVSDNLEYVNSNLQLIRDRIVGEISVDTDEYTAAKPGAEHSHSEECGCGEHADKANESIYFDEEPEEYITLQCCCCEELFFIEKHDEREIVECPFCRKHVRVGDCLID